MVVCSMIKLWHSLQTLCLSHSIAVLEHIDDEALHVRTQALCRVCDEWLTERLKADCT